MCGKEEEKRRGVCASNQPTKKIGFSFLEMKKKCGLPEYTHTHTCTARLSIEINNGAGFLSLSLSLSLGLSRARSLSRSVSMLSSLGG